MSSLDRTIPSLSAARAGPLHIGLLVAAIGWILDQATKAWAVRALGSGDVIWPSLPIHLELTYNEGAAFGLPVPWWVFPIVTVVVVVLVVRNLPQSSSFLEPFAYGLLLAGALGNMSDRLFRPDPQGVGRGEVVDFIASDVWPTFNVADVCISVGFVLLLLAAYLHERAASRHGTEPVDGRLDEAARGDA